MKRKPCAPKAGLPQPVKHWRDTATPEQLRIAEQYREYDRQWMKFHDAEPKDGDRYGEAIKAIHHFAENDEWFAEHTPVPFAQSHWSYVDHLAGLCCEYMQNSARAGNKQAIRELASLAVELTETLTELLADESDAAETVAKEVKWWVAEQLPYWPMLQFRNAAANNHFSRIADKIGLGEKCYLNVSERANYSLRTPINRFAWKCLRHFQKVHSILERECDKKTVEEALATCVFREVSPPVSHRRFTGGIIHVEEIPIYKRSWKLPPLTKATAEQWADAAIMPYVKIRFPDLRRVSELKGLNTGNSGKRYAPVRKALIQALRQVSRKP